ncbi:MAG: acylphosphatase [Parcubacteria group bacterium Gr01-1014_106]|nr:MAG: acylphosphatase [Parcubacteria group bacterium Gr01-1014_106]
MSLVRSSHAAQHMEHRTRVTCRIAGKVHGIGFRFGIRDLATRVQLTGTVRNVADGTVEVVAEGPADALETLRAFCYRGPDGANGTRVEISEAPATGEFSSFEIR